VEKEEPLLLLLPRMGPPSSSMEGAAWVDAYDLPKVDDDDGAVMDCDAAARKGVVALDEASHGAAALCASFNVLRDRPMREKLIAH